MGKAVALDWNAFIDGHVVPKNKKSVYPLLQTALGIHLAFAPTKVLAAGVKASAWANVFSTVLGIADWLCVGVVVFAGATWMFSNRTKALEMLIGGASGYLIIRHAKDIQEWLSQI
ncbi:hypothetical protein DNHGIG_26110 [Collibacillus ludicampi]|uniref:Glycosyltransferase n=1 Tax=Collibacillus ludicampi TaxID=2771369 RepID=A0AAV4LGX4_9BACL|nr:hypothetical protein [Collibacillus ludicampi]GIM47062.1 hypothetical protein DNHGIG_26110 [Collibacillus ludicampi]